MLEKIIILTKFSKFSLGKVKQLRIYSNFESKSRSFSSSSEQTFFDSRTCQVSCVSLIIKKYYNSRRNCSVFVGLVFQWFTSKKDIYTKNSS